MTEQPRVLRAMLGSVSLPFADRAEGVHVWDTEGRRYLDATGGPFTSSFGHSVPEIIEAITRQLGRVTLSILHSAEAEELARLVLEDAGPRYAGVFFTNSGSEAVEAAMKLVLQLHYVNGEPERNRFIAVRDAYHGVTMGAVSATGHPLFREDTGWRSLLLPVAHVPPPQEGDDLASADALARAIEAEGPERVAGFVSEPIFEWTNPGAGYFQRLREICDAYGIPWIADEIRTGFGKMGAPFGMQVRGVRPDIVVFGKGVSGGYAPIAGMAIDEGIVERLRERRAHFYHGHTFAGNPLSAASAVAVQRYARERGLFERVAGLERDLVAMLDDLVATHPNAKRFQGTGVMQFLELELPRRRATRWELYPMLLEEGLIAIVIPTGGRLGLAVAPPFVFEPADLSELHEKLGRVIARFAD